MKILIVEDEIFTALFLKDTLTDFGHEVVGIADDLKSFQKEVEKSPSMCLVDLRLANGDSGIAVAKILHDKRIPFVYLTANNEVKTVKEAIQFEPQAYISKPFKENDILAAIELIERKYFAQKVKIKTLRGEEEIPISTILYAKSDHVYVDIFFSETVSKSLRISLTELEQVLGHEFKRVHRSYLVNVSKITSIKSTSLRINDINIPLSRSYKAGLKTTKS